MNSTEENNGFSVLYEDNHLIAVNKAGGVLVQGDETGDKPLSERVKDYLKEKYAKPGNVFTGVIHRIDRPVSGLVLLAKTSKALQRMNEQFREKSIKKTYFAVVNRLPSPSEATLVHWLTRNAQKNRTSAFFEKKPESQRAELSYSVRKQKENFYLLEIHPVTGRQHQIRVQLAAIGCPINGDLKYGSTVNPWNNSIALHAFSLRFSHPVKKEWMEIQAPFPDTILWSSLEGDL